MRLSKSLAKKLVTNGETDSYTILGHICVRPYNALSVFPNESFRELRPWGKYFTHTQIKPPVPSDVVDHECPCSAAVVGAGDSPEALLSRCVPNLQLDLLAAHLNYPCTKLYANCMGAVCHDWGGKSEVITNSV